MKSKHLLLTLLLALLVPWAANAQTLTVHDASGTNNYVPFYGYYADEDQTNQMIYPATELADMNGKAITEMVFYWQEGYYYGNYYGVGTWTVSLGETTATTLSGLDNTTSLTPVFTGVLDEAGGLFDNTAYTLTIAFDDQYDYGGGNLLVQFSHTGTGEYEYYAFEGESVTGASYCYNSQRNFLPKTTFSYSTPSSCVKPENLALNYTEGNPTATVTWESTASKFNVDINGTITAVNQKTYTFNVDPATTYTVKVQADCGGGELSGWTSTSFFSGCTGVAQLPYSYGFENAVEIDCWTVNATGTYSSSTGVSTNYPRTGTNSFRFFYTTNPPQYLISPEFSGYSNGLHVEFWYRQYSSGVETFQVGYSSTTTDDSAFTWGEEITASTTYQRFSANYPVTTKYVAVKHTSDDQYYLYLDDFLFEESASCLEPTNVVASNETTTGATLNWTAGGEETMWDIYVTDDATVVPNDGTTPTVANTSTKPYPLTSLTPATTYYAYVRAKCSSTDFSAWGSPAIFNTDCIEKNLPYSYGFEDNEFDICWSTINTYTSYCSIDIMDPTGSSGNNVLAFYRGSSTGTLVAVSPEISSSYPLNGYQITFDACFANGTGGSMTAGKLGIGIMTDPTDFTTFQLIEEVDITDGFSTYGTHTVMFNSYTGSGQYIAIQDIYTQSGYVLVDNIAVTELPSCLPPTGVTVNGGLQAVVSWTGTADSFDIAFSDDPTVDPKTVIVGNSTTNSFNLYEAVTLAEGVYTVWVRSNCGGSYSTWASTTLSLSYCTPNPTSHDGKGITAVSFGTGAYVVENGDGSASLPASSPYYGDYSSMIGAVRAGVEATIAITTGTGSFPYVFVIWVDLDNDFTFEDDEILYVGEASTGNGTLNATITIPGSQALGDYRMRIYGADSYFDNFYNSGTPDYTKPHDPCSSGTYRHAHDYTVRVLEAPSCLTPTGLDATNITAQSADLSWTANSGETSWNIFYKKTSETEYTELKKVTDNPYPLTGLDAATDYEYYVVANCSTTETSDPSAVYYFTTECGAITITAATKYTQNFESPVVNSVYNSTTGLEVPVCWENPYTTSASAAGNPHLVRAGASYNYSSSQVLLFYGSGYNYVTLPEFTNALNELQITFKWATESNSNGTLTLGYITDGDVNYNTFTEIAGASYTASSGSYHTLIQAAPVYLNTLPSTAKRLAFRWYCSSQLACNIDDLEVSLMPSCYPLGTLTYDNLASQTVDLHWTLVDATQDAWQVCINGDETNPVEITATDVTISGNAVTYSMAGLTAETDYTVKVRANCGGSDFSDWSNTVSFTTLAACATPTGLAANNLTMVGAVLSWTGSSDVTAYTVQYRTAAGLQTHYFEGFENGLGDWTKVDCANSTGISTGSSYAHTGTASFKFSYNTNPPQYLVSPAISGITSGMQLEFWYKNGSTTYPETFQVGFSSTDNDVASFAFEDEITASDTQWHSYSVAVPATTKYLCFKLNSNDKLSLYIDDITIGAVVDAGTWQTAANDVTAWNYELAGLTASVKYDARVYANCETNPDANNAMTTFTTLADGTMVFNNASGDGMWSTAANWTPSVPTIADNAVIRANVTINSGIVATANNISFEGATTPTLTIADGGQLQHNNTGTITATVKKTITGYNASNVDTNLGYVLFAPPFNKYIYTNNSDGSGLRNGTYDLYSWSPTNNLEWTYYGSNNGTYLYMNRGTGYLYANQETTEVTFTGGIYGSGSNYQKYVSYTAPTAGTTDFADWNLIGNPFVCDAYLVNASTGGTALAYYRMNGDGNGFVTVANGAAIAPMEGIFYQATSSGSVYMTRTAPAVTSTGNGQLNINLAQNVTTRGAKGTTDNAIIRFGEGNTLEKFSFREGSSKVYISQEGKDYAVVNAEAQGEIPVSFKAEKNGSYSLSFTAEEVSFSYLHLIDNLTGVDVDLLETPAYTFDARTSDYASRFKLVFAVGNSTEDNFAYFNNGSLVINNDGNATVQVVDVMGRILSSETINGSANINVNAAAGVYVIRLINGENVKTQKIVVR